jgi:nicotinate-nucleotide adenylyltransferase
MTRRIGVMGGMFDPVHTGHIAAALAALDALLLDELRLIPCADPNHRDAAVAGAADRVAMLELAARVDQRLLVDDRELKRTGISYTVDTLLTLHEDFPADIFVLVLGEDAFHGLPYWHKWQELFALCHICVINRPDTSQKRVTADSAATRALNGEVAKRQVHDLDALFSECAGRIFFLKKEGLQIASSDLRRQILAGGTEIAATMLPEDVVHYIAEHDLYRVS